MKRVERIHRPPLRPGGHNGARHRMHDPRPPNHHLARRRRVLGYPGPVVQQPRNVQERRDIRRLGAKQPARRPIPARPVQRTQRPDPGHRPPGASASAPAADTRPAAPANTDRPRHPPAITRCTASARSTVRANTEIVSTLRHAGAMPVAETLPIGGFSPTILPNAPGTCPAPKTFRGTPYGLRTSTRPVASWSRLVLPRSPTTAAPPAPRPRAYRHTPGTPPL